MTVKDIVVRCPNCNVKTKTHQIKKNEAISVKPWKKRGYVCT
jgi:hypothetical protein